MVPLRIARFVNLLLASVLTGNELGTGVSIHPALRTLPPAGQVAAEQAVTRRYGRLMPSLMTGTILSCLPVLALVRDRRSAAFRGTLAGLGCHAAMLLVTLVGNMPLNRRTLAASPQAPPPDWAALRGRWERLHAARVLLDLAGWSLLVVGALGGGSDPGDGRDHGDAPRS